jgi:hypothetical protein
MSERLEGYNVEPDEGGQLPDWLIDQAGLVNDAVDSGRITSYQAATGFSTSSEIAGLMQPITHFVELPPDRIPLQERGMYLLNLLSRTGLGRDLIHYQASHGMSVSLAMSTLDQTTAEAIRRLNVASVPVTGWIVLPDEQGYWTSPVNIGATVERTEQVIRWSRERGVKLAGFGFDVEKPLPLVAAAANFLRRPDRLVRQMAVYGRAARYERRVHGDPKVNFERHLGTLAERGYHTETYTFPRPLKYALGGMDTRVADRYVEMLYTTELTPQIVRWRRAGAVAALGIVADENYGPPGRRLKAREGKGKHLTEDELARNMAAVFAQRIRQRVDQPERPTIETDPLYIFAMNGPAVPRLTMCALQRALGDSLKRVLPPSLAPLS